MVKMPPKEKVNIPVCVVVGEYDIPSWAICYLVYGDKDGLTDEDIITVDTFLEQNNLVSCGIDVTEEYDEFNTCPAFGLACDTYTVRFVDLAERRRK